MLSVLADSQQPCSRRRFHLNIERTRAPAVALQQHEGIRHPAPREQLYIFLPPRTIHTRYETSTGLHLHNCYTSTLPPPQPAVVSCSQKFLTLISTGIWKRLFGRRCAGVCVNLLFKMVQISPDVAWGILRKNHSYLMKRDHCKPFSKERYNLKNIHSKKYNGFIPKSVIDVCGTKGNRGIVISHRKKGHQYRPAQNYCRESIRTSDRHIFRHIRILTRGLKCRQDLEMTALARASTILRAQQRIANRKPMLYKKKAKKAKKAKKDKKTKKAAVSK
ncbi:Ribosomal L28e/Mak16 [Trinorchestia longiramus]|nr:Ribosomal L28e/Mak16 [Trinorchestia longiramus]